MRPKRASAEPPKAKKRPAKKVAAYTRQSGKRIGPHVRRSHAIPRNPITGKPRRWIYKGWRLRVDLTFQIAEAEASFPKQGIKAAPLRLIKRMLDAYDDRADSLRRELERRELTEAERRYCSLEEINPKDFLAAKLARN